MAIVSRAWLLLLLVPAAAFAQEPSDTLTPMQVAVACAPPPAMKTAPTDAIRVIGAQSTVPRTLFGFHDNLVVNGGSSAGVALGERFFVRRRVHFGSPMNYEPLTPRSVQTGGWVRISAVNDTTAIASVEHVCGPLYAGDYLEPFTVPEVPAEAGHVDTTGTLDFSALARILYGDDERPMAANGEFMLMDRGSDAGVAPGARFAIYRDLHVAGAPLSSIGEAVVVTTGSAISVVRINATRDAVRSGDVLVPRRQTRD